MLFSRFSENNRGSVVVLFALGLIPLFGVVGAAVDYSTANSTKAGMQAAVDAAALALAKDAPRLSLNQMSPRAGEYFAADFRRLNTQCLRSRPHTIQRTQA